MDLEYKTLESRFVRLEPLAERHKEEWRAAANADPELFGTLYAYSMAGEHFDPLWEKVNGEIARGITQCFAVIVHGRCIGVTCYNPIDHINSAVEIGSTYYHPDYRGGATNPAAKRLLLANAFEAGARRVQFKVDATNLRSRAAVLKLGATFEGILRSDRVVWTGRVRDTAFYSILADEWPAVRERLDARLATFDPG
jgi:RimJ/RimL family protein N-acetyltransferase